MGKCNTWESRIAKKVQADTILGFGGRMGLKLTVQGGTPVQADTGEVWRVGRRVPGIEGVAKKVWKSTH